MRYLSDVDYRRVAAYLQNLGARTDMIDVCPSCVCIDATRDGLAFACDRHYSPNYRSYGRVLYNINSYRGGRTLLFKSHNLTSKKVSDFIRHVVTTAAASLDGAIMRHVMRAINGKVWGDVSHLMAFVGKAQYPHICEVSLSIDAVIRQPVLEAIEGLIPDETSTYDMGLLLEVSRSYSKIDHSETPTGVMMRGKMVEISDAEPPHGYMDIFGHVQNEKEPEEDHTFDEVHPVMMEVQEEDENAEPDEDEFVIPPNHEDE